MRHYGSYSSLRAYLIEYNHSQQVPREQSERFLRRTKKRIPRESAHYIRAVADEYQELLQHPKATSHAPDGALGEQAIRTLDCLVDALQQRSHETACGYQKRRQGYRAQMVSVEDANFRSER